MVEEKEEEQENLNNNKKKTERKYKINKANNKKITGFGSPLLDPAKLRQIALAGAYALHKVRGLAATDPETLKRVVLAGGKARAKDIEGLRKAEVKGGQATKGLFGVEYYHEIGKRGGTTTLERYSVEWYSTIGKKGNGNNATNNNNRKKKKEQKL